MWQWLRLRMDAFCWPAPGRLENHKGGRFCLELDADWKQRNTEKRTRMTLLRYCGNFPIVRPIFFVLRFVAMASKAIHIAALTLLAANAAVRAEVLFETYDPSNSSNSFPIALPAASLYAPFFPGHYDVYGAEFTPIHSGMVSSLVANVAVDNLIPPDVPATYELKLFEGSPLSNYGPPFYGTPAPIDTFTEVVNPGAALTNITFASTLHPFLTAGDTYWLYQSIPLDQEQVLDWGVLSNAPSGLIDYATLDVVFVNHDISSGALPAFQLNSAPEPGFQALIGVGLILLTGCRSARLRKFLKW
jgi:hypothetical protein